MRKYAGRDVKLTKEIIEERRPRQEIKEVIGELKVLKIFGETKGKRVVGGKVTTGRIAQGSNVKIMLGRTLH